MQTLDQVTVSAIINRGSCSDSFVPSLPANLTVLCKVLTMKSCRKLSKNGWQKEQEDDSNRRLVVTLATNRDHLQYSAKEGDPSGM